MNYDNYWKPSFRLKDLKNGMFQLHSVRKGAYEGTPGIIFDKAQNMGIKEIDLKAAVNRMHREDSHMADFDGNGNLLIVWKVQGGRK